MGALLLLPTVASGEPPATVVVDAVRAVEHASGRVAAAAVALRETAASIAADGRLHSLARLEHLQARLEREQQGLQRAVTAAHAALPEGDAAR